VSLAPIAADIHQPLDVLPNDATQVTFNDKLALHHLPKPIDLFLYERTHLPPWVNPARLERAPSQGPPDTVDIRQRNLDMLLARDIHPGYSRHNTNCLSGVRLGHHRANTTG
jgi:hypothetical protein